MTTELGATYRIQLTPGRGFDHAAGLVDHLARLGVQWLYCSPITEAVPGSTHGYDGTDPTKLRAELGGVEAFTRLAEACSASGLGCLVDIVPNHLSTWSGGPWWRELLRTGPDGEMGEVFDIDWRAADNKVILPILDRPLGELIDAGAITAAVSQDGEPALALGDVLLPVRNGPLRRGDDLTEVLAEQWYRLVDWHDRRERNYRRFFDIDGLVGVRVERAEVFARTHVLVAELVNTGLVTALRVDHVDGLADPEGYLRRLQGLTGGIPVVVEKILTRDEQLRASWPVVGTTGYEVLDDIGGALVDASGLDKLAAAAESEGEPSVEECTTATRRLVAEEAFTSELERASAGLDVDRKALAAATTRLRVYRTYLRAGDELVHPDDDDAIAAATVGLDGLRTALTDLRHRSGAMAWQQITGAVMAKGVEDTAWYRLPGRIAFCEVGGDPARSRVGGVERLHVRATARAANGHAGLVPATTHDTKRSGDSRARLYAMSELAGAFEQGLERYRQLLTASLGGQAGTRDRVEVTRAQSRFVAQAVLSVLPPDEVVRTGADRGGSSDDELNERVTAALVKGAREAKLRSSWEQPDLEFEEVLGELARLSLASGARLMHDSFGDLVGDVARLGATISLSGVLLRSSLPGVPDCYQGDESWNLALVDPDNRREVDFEGLRRQLASLDGRGIDDGGFSPRPGAAAALRREWRTGRVKMLVTIGCLHARRTAPAALSPSAAYHPVEATGPAASSVIASVRTARLPDSASTEQQVVLAIATRLASHLDHEHGDLPAGRRSYGVTALELPGWADGQFVDALTGRRVSVHDERIEVAEALEELPVALLVRA